MDSRFSQKISLSHVLPLVFILFPIPIQIRKSFGLFPEFRHPPWSRSYGCFILHRDPISVGVTGECLSISFLVTNLIVFHFSQNLALPCTRSFNYLILHTLAYLCFTGESLPIDSVADSLYSKSQDPCYFSRKVRSPCVRPQTRFILRNEPITRASPENLFSMSMLAIVLYSQSHRPYANTGVAFIPHRVLGTLFILENLFPSLTCLMRYLLTPTPMAHSFVSLYSPQRTRRCCFRRIPNPMLALRSSFYSP